MIRVTDFGKVYRNTVAVAGITFEVGLGQILGLIGPNGAGKTTTLRALAGIIPPTQGRLSVAGHDVVRKPLEAKQRLAYVPDDPVLFEALTVWEHFEFTAAAYRIREFEEQANALLKLFEIDAKRNVPAQELSRGMRQKVVIACAYLQRPRAILFDEPLSGLDPRGIRTIKQSIRDLARDGASVVISSHLLALVEDLCTHVLILHDGQNRFFGEVTQARNVKTGAQENLSLEEVFFHVTGEQVPT